MSILLVEDDPAEARLIQRAFTKAQIALPVVRVDNGDEAVAYLQGDGRYSDRSAHPLPTLILLDVKLPRRSGLEVLEWIRSQQGILRRVPVIMLSSSRHATDINRAYDLGANSYLTKPETSEDLLAIAQTFRRYWLEINQAPREGIG